MNNRNQGVTASNSSPASSIHENENEEPSPKTTNEPTTKTEESTLPTPNFDKPGVDVIFFSYIYVHFFIPYNILYIDRNFIN